MSDPWHREADEGTVCAICGEPWTCGGYLDQIVPEACPNYPQTCLGCVECRTGDEHNGPCVCDCTEGKKMTPATTWQCNHPPCPRCVVMLNTALAVLANEGDPERLARDSMQPVRDLLYRWLRSGAGYIAVPDAASELLRAINNGAGALPDAAPPPSGTPAGEDGGR